MNLKTLTLVCGLAVFSVSCAHKNKDKKDDLAKTTKQEIKLVDHKVSVDESQGAYTCDVLKDKRLITLDKNEGRCEIHYTKFGEKAQVAWARATPSLCTEVFARIRKNIEDRGFQCTTLNKKQEKENRETASR